MSLIFAILLFSLLVFVHELGHFVCAKLSGIQVNEFALFLGPAIFKKQVGETLYSIRCIPFGGYCAMEGEDEDVDNPRAFHRAAWWKRLIVLVAGAAMNFIMGVAMLAIVFAPAQAFAAPVVGAIEDGCLLAGEDGLQVGDRIVELDGEKIYLYSNFTAILSLKGGDVHDLVLERDGERIVLDDFRMEKAEFLNGDGTTSLRYGFNFSIVEATFKEKISYTWNTVLDTVRSVRLSLQMLFGGQAGIADLSGPVGIVNQMSQVAQESPTWVDAALNLLYFGGFIAINLAVMNLLPIPALDGGRVVGLLITTVVEAVIRRKIDPKYEGYLHGAGMILLLGLMAVIMFKDIFVIFKG